jgi:hypothetical protein
MITLRQHLISLIAVFLALGLGVLAGTTFISPNAVKTLQKAVNVLNQRETSLEDQNNALTQQLQQMTTGATAVRDRIVAGALDGQAAVLVAFDTTPAAEIAAVAQTLEEAGAHLEGSFVLASTLGIPNETARQQVVTTLGLPTTATTETIEGSLVQRLADSLDGRVPGFLSKLVAAGLAAVASVPAPAPPQSVALPGSDVVILAPGQDPPGTIVGPDFGSQLILPLARILSGAGVLQAVAEDGSTQDPVLGLLRGEPTLRAVTVDGIDTPLGQASLVLGLQDAAAGLWGNYGSGPGASAPFPSPVPAAASPSPVSTALAGTPRG